MIFRKVEKNHYSVLCSYLKNCGISICDFTCGALIMWHDFYNMEFCIDESFLYLRDGGQVPTYTIPIGKGDFASAVKKLEPFATDGRLKFNSVTVEKAVELKQLYGDKMSYRFNRDVADYIYDAQSMITFAGKKLSAIRNHINRFKKEYPDYQFVPMNRDNIQRVRDFVSEFNSHRDLRDLEARAEANGIFTLMDHLDLIDWCGGFIELDGKIIAISIGEYVDDCLVIHVEKADTSYSGCYQIMVNEFAKAFVKDHIKYINREDDVGLEGLRKSKMAYRPIKLLDKAEVEIVL